MIIFINPVLLKLRFPNLHIEMLLDLKKTVNQYKLLENI